MQVTKINGKDVNTKFGLKKSYSFMADGEWYNHGFKKPTFNEGDDITFSFSEGKYGKDVDVASVRVVGSGRAPTAATVAGSAAPKSGGYMKAEKPFPVPALHGDRAIIRQNALTNAREAWVASNGGKAFTFDPDVVAAAVLSLARKFEAYSTGDLDVEMAKEMMASEGGA